MEIRTPMAQGRRTNIIPMIKWIRNIRLSTLSLALRAGERGMRAASKKVDIRLPGKGNSNCHGARPIY